MRAAPERRVGGTARSGLTGAVAWESKRSSTTPMCGSGSAAGSVGRHEGRSAHVDDLLGERRREHSANVGTVGGAITGSLDLRSSDLHRRGGALDDRWMTRVRVYRRAFRP